MTIEHVYEHDPDNPAYVGLDEDTYWEWFDTHDIVHERRRREAAGLEENEWWLEREQLMVDGFKRHPRKYDVADCEHCDWSMGGWLSGAGEVLLRHIEREHGKPKSKKG